MLTTRFVCAHAQDGAFLPLPPLEDSTSDFVDLERYVAPSIPERGDEPMLLAALERATNAAQQAADEPAESQTKDKKPNEKKPLGEAPADNSRVFLRQSAVLLKQGTLEVEWGLRYALQESDFPALSSANALMAETADQHSVFGTLSVRYGWKERWQPFVTIPAGASFFARANSEFDTYDDRYGLGDITAGINHLWRDGQNECADIIVGLTAIAPTGQTTFNTLSPNFASLGNGFAGVNLSVTAIRTYDPVVIFATLGYTQQFGARYFDRLVEPGPAANAAFGVGFSVNDDISLSTQFQALAQLDYRVDGDRLSGSGNQVAVLRHSVVRRVCKQSFVEYFVSQGVTDDAPAFTCGVLSTTRY
ncbi:MAG: transporter [Pirellulales bacterium]